MQKKNIFKICILLSVVFTIVLLPSSLAYFVSKNTLTNKLRIGQNINQINTEVSEIESYRSDTSYSAKTSIKNIASIDCFIRVFVAIDSTMVSTDFDYDTQNWNYNSDDGYYYYKYSIKPNESTTPLFNEIKINDIETKENFEVLIYSESVQSYSFSSPEEAFSNLK